MNAVLTAEDRELLQRPLHGFFTAAGGEAPPQPRPVWFEVSSSGAIQLFTAPNSPKVRQLTRDSRASLIVAAPVGERERWVSIAGPVTIQREGARELLKRLAARYWAADEPERAAELAAMLDQEWVRILIHPEKVSRYAM
ncbi:pyridoxamine 5'-phosphate oxidase family protein [Mycolicibacterium duvalii]|uniref:Pyridoxamine 5'-phosphate oxidase n=1 Tax=Mycolicibacterium duvalii TaxID=39688 RepID=A0A7I7K5I8_9MYCO|nr:pyridoxamine 5'-phosphate oxidase family protein [Mycolicibacterium duvalii]BBX19376.1 pyridoxamine 5'-phosphate oxidase [Mycolicibacterium duvalii]